jgi:hypothetical protein
MSDQTAGTPRVPQPGDRVQILNHPGMKGRIVELRKGLRRDGRNLYRVTLFNQPKPAYIEMGAEQIVFLDDQP